MSSHKRKDIPASIEADGISSIFSRNARRMQGPESLKVDNGEPTSRSPSNLPSRVETPKANNRSIPQQSKSTRQILSAVSHENINQIV